MKYIGIILLAWLSIPNQSVKDLYVCKNAKISFFSSAPIEDIEATSTKGASVFNAATGDLGFSVPIRTFQFEKALMQEHFNSDYLESDKFPQAIFKGRIEEHIDVTKNGIYPVKVTGDLQVHGVTIKKTIQGSVTVRNGEVSMSSEFIVKCAEHHIEIPQVVFHHIAENIRLTVSAAYSPYK